MSKLKIEIMSQCAFLENGQRCMCEQCTGQAPIHAVNSAHIPPHQGATPDHPTRLPAGTIVADCGLALGRESTTNAKCNPIHN